METIAGKRLFNIGLLVLMPYVVTRVYRSALITNTESNYAWPAMATVHTFVPRTRSEALVQTTPARRILPRPPTCGIISTPHHTPHPPSSASDITQPAARTRGESVTCHTSPARRRAPRCGA